MSVSTSSTYAAPGAARGLAWRIAKRELAGGLGALRLLAACLFLGVLALSGVGSLSSAIVSGLQSQGRTILGGDVEVRTSQRGLAPAEAAALGRLGVTSESVRMRAMVRSASDGQLGELKAVDSRWPLVGRATLLNGGDVQAALARGAVLAPALADRLGVKIGDEVSIGNISLPVSGLLGEEPDRAGQGFALGPTALVSRAALLRSGLEQPGSLYTTHLRVRMPDPTGAPAAADAIRKAFPDSGLRVADSRDGAPGVRRFVERLGQFLTLVGLTALAVAGVGVMNGVASYLDTKARTIAVMKTLGASVGLIGRAYLLQIAVVAAAASLAGALVGALVPWIVARAAGDALPVAPDVGLQPVALLVALSFGMLVALAVALPPLARAGALPAARLLRGAVERWPWPARRTLAISALAASAVVALAVLPAREPLFALAFLAAAAALLVLLWALGWLVQFIASRAPRPRGVLARLALANLHRPGAMTRQLVVALGLGLTLFATLALVETSFRGALARTVPTRAPGYFILDLPKEDGAAFRRVVERAAPGSKITMVPSLRGPLTAVNGVPISKLGLPESAWIARGDRGLTFSAAIPAGNTVVAGRWWPADYTGEPLVSVDAEAAQAANLKIGDRLTVSVLGVEVTARVANLRRVDWDGLGINFALVFDPSVLAGAPYTWLATATPPNDADPTRALSAAFPTASVIRVKDVVGQVGELLGQMGVAVRVAASVAILAGAAVLVGALAAQARARIYDSVILKLLGATRAQVLRSAALEFAGLGLLVAGLALALGAGAAWFTVTRVLELPWLPDWRVAAAVVAGGGALTLALGLAGAARALGAKPNAVLRQL